MTDRKVPQPEKQEQEYSKPPKKRKYGNGDSHPIPIWNGILEHHSHIGPAIWEFLWLIDRVTFEDENKIGWCLGRRPIKSEEIAKSLEQSKDATHRNLVRLELEGYIVRTRTPYGHIIGVRNSRKFGIWSSHERSKQSQTERSATNGTSESGQKCQVSPDRELAKMRQRVGKNAKNKEDAASTQQLKSKSLRSKQTDSYTDSPTKPVGPDLSSPNSSSQVPSRKPSKTERQHILDVLNTVTHLHGHELASPFVGLPSHQSATVGPI